MFDFVSDVISGMTWQRAILGVVLFLITFSGSLALVSFILIKLPADYFCSHYDRQLWSGRAPALRIAAAIGKNVLGVVLILLGIVMSLPGVPGQGLLTILLASCWLIFPGKTGWNGSCCTVPRSETRLTSCGLDLANRLCYWTKFRDFQAFDV